jgi:hypothetical protein
MVDRVSRLIRIGRRIRAAFVELDRTMFERPAASFHRRHDRLQELSRAVRREYVAAVTAEIRRLEPWRTHVDVSLMPQ